MKIKRYIKTLNKSMSDYLKGAPNFRWKCSVLRCVLYELERVIKRKPHTSYVATTYQLWVAIICSTCAASFWQQSIRNLTVITCFLGSNRRFDLLKLHFYSLHIVTYHHNNWMISHRKLLHTKSDYNIFNVSI